MARIKGSKTREPEVLRGTKAIAEFVFGTPDAWRQVYPLRVELGLFKMGLFLCGHRETITALMAERARKAAARAGRTKAA
jgi:hypothetical protein